MRYICVKRFVTNRVDDDGCLTYEDGFLVDEGSIWGKTGDAYITDVKNGHHLENVDSWMEIDDDTLSDCFKEVPE